MGQQHSNGSSHMPLFPFLAVLMCTMGALILLLVVTARQIRKRTGEPAPLTAVAGHPAPITNIPDPLPIAEQKAGGQSVATVESPAPPNAVAAPLEPEPFDEEFAQKQAALREEWLARVAQMRRELTDAGDDLFAAENAGKEKEREIAAALEAHQELKESQQALDQRRQKVAAREQQNATQRKFANGSISALEAKLQSIKAARATASSRYAITAYNGESGTARHPIVIDCSAERILFAAENVALSADQMSGFEPDFNPFRSATAVLAQYLLKNARVKGEAAERPYVLFLVRPDGVQTYYIARGMLGDLPFAYGIELVPQDIQLAWPPADPKAIAAMNMSIARTLKERGRLARGGSPLLANGESGVGGDASTTGVDHRGAGGFVSGDGTGGFGDGGIGNGLGGTSDSSFGGPGDAPSSHSALAGGGAGLGPSGSGRGNKTMTGPSAGQGRGTGGSMSGGGTGFGGAGPGDTGDLNSSAEMPSNGANGPIGLAKNGQGIGRPAGNGPDSGGSASGGTGGGVGAAPGSDYSDSDGHFRLPEVDELMNPPDRQVYFGNQQVPRNGPAGTGGNGGGRGPGNNSRGGAPLAKSTPPALKPAPEGVWQETDGGSDSSASSDSSAGRAVANHVGSAQGSANASDSAGRNVSETESEFDDNRPRFLVNRNPQPSGDSASSAGGRTRGPAGGPPSLSRGAPGPAGRHRGAQDREAAAQAKRWGYNDPGARIGYEKDLKIDVLPDRLMVSENLIVKLPDGASREAVEQAFTAIIEAAAQSWGDPPVNFYWLPRITLRIHTGGNRHTARLKTLAESWGLKVNLDQQLD